MLANVTQDVIASSVNRVVVGLGVTGLSCARYFHRRGLPFSVVDTRADAPGLDAFRKEMPDVPVYAGAYPAAVVAGATEMVVSPGVAMDAPVVEQARAAGVSIVGDIDLFVREAAAPAGLEVLAVAWQQRPTFPAEERAALGRTKREVLIGLAPRAVSPVPSSAGSSGPR